MSKTGLQIATATLAFTTLFFAYRAFDAGVTITYHEAEMDHLRQNAKVMARIATVLASVQSASQADVEHAIRRELSDQLIEREGDVLFVARIALQFKDGLLATIEHSNELLAP